MSDEEGDVVGGGRLEKHSQKPLLAEFKANVYSKISLGLDFGRSFDSISLKRGRTVAPTENWIFGLNRPNEGSAGS